MNKFLFILIFVVIFQALPAQDKNILLEAKALQIQGNFEQSNVLLKSANLKDKFSILLEAENYYNLKDYKKALKLYLIADSLKKETVSLNIATCYAQLSDFNSTIKWLTFYLKQKSKLNSAEIQDNPAFNNIINTKEWKELWKTEWYSTSEIEIHSVKSLLKYKQYSEALIELDNSSNIIFPKAELYYLQALAYEGLKQLEPAQKNIKLALELNSKNEDYLLLSTQINTDLNNFSDAKNAISQAIELNPVEPTYLKIRGTLENSMGQNSAALTDLKLYTKMFSKSSEGIYELAKAENLTGNPNEALNSYANLVSIDSSKAIYYTQYSETAISLGKYELAEENINKSLDLDPFTENNNLVKAKIRLYFEDVENACRYLQKAPKTSEAQNLYKLHCLNQ